MILNDLTKGAVSRELLHHVMSGYMPIAHCAHWDSKLPAAGNKQQEASDHEDSDMFSRLSCMPESYLIQGLA